MAKKNEIKDAKRLEVADALVNYFNEMGEDAGLVKNNALCFPIVLNGEDEWITITVTIPSGSRDGEPYDGYGLREEYEMNLEEKRLKAEAAAKKKAEKVARDEKRRAKAKENASK